MKKTISIILITTLLLLPVVALAQNGGQPEDSPDQSPGEEYKEKIQDDPRRNIDEETEEMKQEEKGNRWFGESIFISPLTVVVLIGLGIYLIAQR
ncbi:hypothetical protein JCM16358_21860 [Halanaerocella petrolearia]